MDVVQGEVEDDGEGSVKTEVSVVVGGRIIASLGGVPGSGGGRLNVLLQVADVLEVAQVVILKVGRCGFVWAWVCFWCVFLALNCSSMFVYVYVCLCVHV